MGLVMYGVMVVGCKELLVGKTTLMLGSWLTDHLCEVSELSRLLGSRGISHENYAVFQVSSRSTDWKVD